MFILGQICQNSDAIFESQLELPDQPMLYSLIKHAVSANQNMRYMETLL